MKRELFVAVALFACSSKTSSNPAGESSGAGSSSGSSASRSSVAAGAPLPAMARWELVRGAFPVTRVRGRDETRCAVSRAGEVACWGALAGHGVTRLESGAPHRLADVGGVVDVAVLAGTICVVRRDRTGGCIPTDETTAKLPTALTDVVELGVESDKLCTRTVDGRLVCYSAADRDEPAGPEVVPNVSGATSLTCMANSCCVTAPAGVTCIDDALENVDRDVKGATQIAFSSTGSCVRTQRGGAACTGDAAALARPSGVRAVTFFDDGICVITDDDVMRCKEAETPNIADADISCVTHVDGSASCHGMNRLGELGDGKPTHATKPQRVPDLENVVELRVVHTQVCAVHRDRTLECWGWAPRAKVSTAATALAAGDEPGCWIASGALHCAVAKGFSIADASGWELKRASLKTSPKRWAISGRRLCIADRALRCHEDIWSVDEWDWVTIAAPPIAEIDDFQYGFAVRFGDGRVGYFGHEDAPLTRDMMKMSSIEGATKLASGLDDLCVVTKSGDVRCQKAARMEGELEDIETVDAFRGATQIAAHAYHRCAIVKGELWCAGRNDAGQLGRGVVHDGTEDQPAARVELPFKPMSVGVGERFTCALSDAGHVWCWGTDEHGELGQRRIGGRRTLGRVIGIGP